LTALLPPRKNERRGGFEPPNPKDENTSQDKDKKVLGIEPRSGDPKSHMLPLHHTSIKRDVGRTRTCAPERNRLAVDRVNHSATTSSYFSETGNRTRVNRATICDNTTIQSPMRVFALAGNRTRASSMARINHTTRLRAHNKEKISTARIDLATR
jgi:hypothetical protein